MLGVVAMWFGLSSGLNAQSFITVDKPAPAPITPKFNPAPARGDIFVVPAYSTESAPRGQVPFQPPAPTPIQPFPPIAPGVVRTQAITDDSGEITIRPELPGIERMFMRDSESEFFNRLRQEAKRTPGSAAVIFPTQPVISKEQYTQLPFPRIDPQTKMPFEERVFAVEPCYVCHRRLLFEQPNFERSGYNFGVLQPAICLGVFYYDLLLAPYHFWSDLHDRGECNVGKCLPGDPYAPLLLPVERFSVTGALGQAGAILGGIYFFP